MSKPFNVLAEGLVSKNSRGDRTAIELFLSGVRALALQSSIIDVVRIASRILNSDRLTTGIRIRSEYSILAHFGRCNRRTPGRCARRSDQRPEEQTSPQLHNSAASQQFREFGRKSLELSLTIIVVKAT